MNREELILKGEEQYDNFVHKIGLDINKMKTPITCTLEELGTYSPTDKEFIILSISLIYDEFFNVYTKTERRESN